ncbi:MAG: hemin uptake protein HemP [Pseudomonadota bacterium]
MNAMTKVPQPTNETSTRQIQTYDAREIVKDGVQACLILDDQTYYLRITRAGKLILTK